MPITDKPKKSWLWFVGIYAASLVVFITVVYGLKWLVPGLLFWG